MRTQPEDSINTLEACYRNNPGSLVFSRLADAYRKQGDTQKAIDICNNGLKIHPDYVTARVILGRCYLEQENFSEAIDEFARTCQLDRRNQVAIKMLADTYARQEMTGKAGDLYAYLSRHDPENESLAHLALTVKGSGKSDLFQIVGIAPQSIETTVSVPQSAQESQNQQPVHVKTPPDVHQPPSIRPPEEIEVEQLGTPSTSASFDIIETVDDLAESSRPAASEADIGNRMAMLFEEEEEEEEQIAAGPPVVPQATATAPADRKEPEISGNDISSRIEELFGDEDSTAVSHRPIEPMPASPIERQPLDAFAPPPEQTGDVENMEAATNAISGMDISTRLDELFGEDYHSGPDDPAVATAKEPDTATQTVFPEQPEETPTPTAPENMGTTPVEDSETAGISRLDDIFSEDNIDTDGAGFFDGSDVSESVSAIESDSGEQLHIPRETAELHPENGQTAPDTAGIPESDDSDNRTGIATYSLASDTIDIADQTSSEDPAEIGDDTRTIAHEEIWGTPAAGLPGTKEKAQSEELKLPDTSRHQGLTVGALDESLITAETIGLDTDVIEGIAVENVSGQDIADRLDEIWENPPDDTAQKSEPVNESDFASELPASTPSQDIADIFAGNETDTEKTIPSSGGIVSEQHVVSDDVLAEDVPDELLEMIPDDVDEEPVNDGFYTVSGDNVRHYEDDGHDTRAVEGIENVELDTVFEDSPVAEEPGIFVSDDIQVPENETAVAIDSATDDLDEAAGNQATEFMGIVDEVNNGGTPRKEDEIFLDDGDPERESIPEGDDEDDYGPSQGFYTVTGDDAVRTAITPENFEDEDSTETVAGREPLTETGKDAPFTAEETSVDTDPAQSGEELCAIPDHVLTPTLADIYYQQNQPGLAIQIYRRLLAMDPDNEKISRRLAEIENNFDSDMAQTDSASRTGTDMPQQKPGKKAAAGTKRTAGKSGPLAGKKIKKKYRDNFKKRMK